MAFNLFDQPEAKKDMRDNAAPALYDPHMEIASINHNFSKQTDTLVNDGKLPAMLIIGDKDGKELVANLNQNHDNGFDGGSKPWSQPAFEGSWLTGKRHLTPEDKLRDAEYKGLSPGDKIQYDSENAAAQKYQGDYSQWEFNGKQGPPPHKPDLPMHDKVEASVHAREKAIEANIRAAMTPEEQRRFDQVKAEYEKACAASQFAYLSVPVPKELADYNKKIAQACGLETESEASFWAHRPLRDLGS